MTTYKNTSGDYTITGDNGLGIFTVNYANTVFNGNLTYTGNLTTVDDFITVAANNTGVITDMGLLAQANTTHFAGLRFNTTANVWQISSSVYSNGAPVTAYANIATGNATVAGANTNIQFNSSGNFGGTANLTFDQATNKLTIQGHEAFGNIGTTPALVSNSVVVYNKAVGSGGTGLYVVSASVDDELVSKSKAIVFGIIF
jgi:hypothetical protein